jgi:hypothetical protein
MFFLLKFGMLNLLVTVLFIYHDCFYPPLFQHKITFSLPLLLFKDQRLPEYDSYLVA